LAARTIAASALPDRFASKQGYLALERDFPGASTDPAQIVVSNASGEGVSRALANLRSRLEGDPRFGAAEIERSADGEVAVLSAAVSGDASSSAATDAVREVGSGRGRET